MNESAIAFLSLISIGLLLIFLFWVYRDYCVDAFRQRMFSLRDSLFDKALAGEIDFRDPAYGMLRSTMNGLIRFGHRLSLVQVVAMSFTLSRNPIAEVPYGQRLEQNLCRLDSEQRELIETYYRRMNFTLVRHLLMSSPILVLTVIVPLIVTLKANLAVKQTTNKLRQQLDDLDSIAWAEGESPNHRPRQVRC
jgi:hypothetical protein